MDEKYIYYPFFKIQQNKNNFSVYFLNLYFYSNIDYFTSIKIAIIYDVEIFYCYITSLLVSKNT